MNSVVIFTILYLLFALCPCNHASVLSTFQPEKLRIRVEHRKDSTIISEAIMLLQNHFIRKHQFSRKDWDILRKELGQYEDPHRVSLRIMYLAVHVFPNQQLIIVGSAGIDCKSQ